ncbi:MAG: hypothetical protein AB1756_00200 [Acidobacteriota bacterium]
MHRFRSISILILTLGLSISIFSCVMIAFRPDDSRLVRGPFPPEIASIEKGEDLIAVAELKLHENLGETFPNLTLVNAQNDVVTLEEFRGKRLAILVSTTDCHYCVLWLRDLHNTRWKPPEGYDLLMVLFSSGGTKEFNRLVMNAPNHFLVGWPLIDYLAYARFYPAMYFVSDEGIFEGYKRGYLADPVWHVEVDNKANNN